MKMTAPMEIGICCANLEAMRAFYVNILGCTPVNELEVPPEKAALAGMAKEGYRVARVQTPWGERLKFLQPFGPGERTDKPPPWILERPRIAYITFIVDELQAMIDGLKGAGATFLSGEMPVEVRPSTFMSFIRDPEGNVLEFVEYGDIREYRTDLG